MLSGERNFCSYSTIQSVSLKVEPVATESRNSELAGSELVTTQTIAVAFSYVVPELHGTFCIINHLQSTFLLNLSSKYMYFRPICLT
jgi:hypothetical protein